MSKQQDFRRYAEQCAQMLDDIDLPKHCQDELATMAHAWLQLALEEEQIDEFVRVFDQVLMTSYKGSAVRLGDRPLPIPDAAIH